MLRRRVDKCNSNVSADRLVMGVESKAATTEPSGRAGDDILLAEIQYRKKLAFIARLIILGEDI